MISRTKVNYPYKDIINSIKLSRQPGNYNELVKKELKRYLEIEHVLLTPSGRGGLYYILKAIPKPNVIIPAYTCSAVEEAAKLAGKNVIYVDVEPNEFNISPNSLHSVIDNHSIVIATHQFGIACDIEEIVKICHRADACVVEDVAAALGTKINGKLAGTFGDVAFFSFDSTKLITVPLKGGFICTSNKSLFNEVSNAHQKEILIMPIWHKIKTIFLGLLMLLIELKPFYTVFYLLNFSLRNRYTAETSRISTTKNGFYKYDFSNWQASIAYNQIKNLTSIINKRQVDFHYYQNKLQNCNLFILPPFNKNDENVCIRFAIKVRADKLCYYRKAIKKGVDFGFSFTFITAPTKYVYAHELAASVLNLPYYFKLTDQDRRKVVNTLINLEKRYQEPTYD
ncbi:MAG: DegT/DnrJ/EryC1/StrS family aminotransferase [Planctomycetota bacterium]